MGATLLHVVTSTVRRGAEVFAVDLDCALSARGLEGTVRALAPGPDPHGVDVPTLGHSRLGLTTLFRLRREARDHQVVVGHGSSTLPACVLAMAGLPAPFVYRSIGDPTYWSLDPARQRRTEFFLRRASFVVALWPGAVGPLVESFGVDEERIRVIPNAVRSEGFAPATEAERLRARARLGLPSDAPIVAYLGALAPEKDVGLAIEAVGKLSDATLVVAGEGSERPFLERLASEHAHGRVRFLGAQHDTQRVTFAAADTIVLPSRTEGVPAALIEAGLSQLPVVASDVGGVSDVVLDGVTGILVPPQDSTALIEALRTVLDRPREFGAAARSRCLERFDLDAVASRWAAVLTEVMAIERV